MLDSGRSLSALSPFGLRRDSLRSLRCQTVSNASELETTVKDWLAQPGPALLHVHVNPMQLVMPPFMQVEPAIGMALYSARAVLHGRGGDVWEMVKENFL
jgi:pyruvate dehydrogenase (quinone)